MSIPKIIHQIWLGDKTKRPQRLMNTWITKNPTWTYMVWTEENLPLIINKKQFHEMTQYCGKADILRYELLYNYGGFFIDADSECLKPLEDWLCDNDSFAAYESEQFMPGLIANGYLASTINNSLMKFIIEEISKMTNVNSKPPWLQTGPTLLTNTRSKNSYSMLKIYPSYYFMPRHCRSNSRYSGTDHVFAEQYWGSSWNLYGKI